MVNPADRTEFVRLMVDRFSDDVYGRNNYEDIADYLYIINAPGQSGLEPEMLEFAKAHPDATVKELIDYFESMDPEIVDEDEPKEESRPCPVCGQYDFGEDGDFEECPVCGWVNDGVQRANPDYSGGYNRISLNDARKKWKAGTLFWD